MTRTLTAMDLLNNSWIVSIVGGVISGLIVMRISNIVPKLNPTKKGTKKTRWLPSSIGIVVAACVFLSIYYLSDNSPSRETDAEASAVAVDGYVGSEEDQLTSVTVGDAADPGVFLDEIDCGTLRA